MLGCSLLIDYSQIHKPVRSDISTQAGGSMILRESHQ
jgi:hypothetical protein